MYSFTIKIADINIGIETIHVRPLAICRDYIIKESESPEILIRIKQEDIDLDRTEYISARGYCEKWDGYLEVYTVLKKVADSLIDYGAFLLHGAAICVDNGAIVFVGNSGIGKTTHIKKWLTQLPDAYVINGDKPFIKTGDTPMVCGSPWAGKENMYRNTMIPLKAIVIMERNEENKIQRISFANAFIDLFQQIYRPDNADKMNATLNLLKSLDDCVHFYRYQFNNYKQDCFDIAYDTLSKDCIM